jgi:hypothetical protein
MIKKTVMSWRRPMASVGRTDAPIILGRCPSLAAHESESMLQTYLVCRGKQEKERETSKRHVGEEQCTNNSDPII